MESAEFFGVVADRSRRRVFGLLLEGERTVSDLVRSTRLRQPLVSHHLKVLRAAGLVATRKDGRFRYYRVSSPEVRGLLERLEADAAKIIAAAEAAAERSAPAVQRAPGAASALRARSKSRK